MNGTLQKHYAKFIYVVPDGLRELMSDISREVLRSLPVDIYTFIADYLDALMITRENARVAARLINEIIEISETTRRILEETGITRDEAERAAKVIQRNFRQYFESQHPKKSSDDHEILLKDILEECDISQEHAENAALIIQRALRAFLYMRQQEKLMFGDMIDWKIAARSTIALYRKTGVTDDELHRAATLIKSAYKGYYARKYKSKLLKEAVEIPSEECLCESYSLDLPSVKGPSTVESMECVCSIESEDMGAVQDEEKCLCEYSFSEQMAINKGDKIIPVDSYIPVSDESSRDDGWCYCENNPEIEEIEIEGEMAEPIETNEGSLKNWDEIFDKNKEDDEEPVPNME